MVTYTISWFKMGKKNEKNNHTVKTVLKSNRNIKIVENIYLIQGVMECIFAAAITGILFALFGGQPLNILGSTGPMLVLETIIYNLCKWVN